MPEIVHDCPRCGVPHTTFDVKGAHLLSSLPSWQEVHELFSVCRACAKSSTLVVQTKEPRGYSLMQVHGGIGKTPGVLNHIVRVIGLVSTKDRVTTVPPDYLPASIDAAFREGAACHSIGCINAAAAMFRLCVDLATTPLLPTPEEGGPNHRTARELGLRLPWLFENAKLPEDLHDLSVCIKDDGNDGVHRGSLSSAEAEDLLDFTTELLRRLYTEKERIRLARERKDARTKQ